MNTDKIILEGLTFYGYHGVDPAEQTLGQRFVVDLSLTTDLIGAGRSDDLADTISYAQICRVVRRVVEGPSCKLIEAVAERIAQAVLSECGGQAIRVRVGKPWAPIKGNTAGQASVEIIRERT